MKFALERRVTMENSPLKHFSTYSRRNAGVYLGGLDSVESCGMVKRRDFVGTPGIGVRSAVQKHLGKTSSAAHASLCLHESFGRQEAQGESAITCSRKHGAAKWPLRKTEIVQLLQAGIQVSRLPQPGSSAMPIGAHQWTHDSGLHGSHAKSDRLH